LPSLDDFQGWYLRGDIGMTNQKVDHLFNVLYNAPNTSVSSTGVGFDSGMLFGVGVGFHYNDWIRFDATGEYRGGANFHGLDIVKFNGVPAGTDEYRATKSEWLALANVYADLGTWNCFTPFVGVGIGGVYGKISNFLDINTATAGIAYAEDNAKWNFAWALHAGVGYQVSKNVTIELAYRYLNLGDFASGDLKTYTGTNNVFNPMEFHGVTSHDVKLGVRFQFDCVDCGPPPPPPPPIVRKG
jgi:opacity protein-like surface antigen